MSGNQRVKKLKFNKFKMKERKLIMKTKKLLAMLLALAVVCSAFVMPVMASEETGMDAIETTYLRDGDFLLDIEFSDESDTKNNERVSIDTTTFPGRSVGKFEAGTTGTRLDYIYNTSSKEYSDLKEALESGPVAIEIAINREVKEDSSTGVSKVVKLFNNLFYYSTGGTLRIGGSQGTNTNFTVKNNEWNTFTVILDYHTGSIHINDLIINNTRKILENVNSIETIDNLLTSGIRFMFDSDKALNNVTYIDYIRAYKVSSTEPMIQKENFISEYKVKNSYYDNDFDEAYYKDFEKGERNAGYLSLEKNSSGKAALFVTTESYNAQGYVITKNDELTRAIYGVDADEETGTSGVAPKELVFETRFKVDGTTKNKEIFSPIIKITGGKLKIGNNSYPIDVNTWYSVVAVVDFNSENAIIKKIKINDAYQVISNATFSINLDSTATSDDVHKYFLYNNVEEADGYFLTGQSVERTVTEKMWVDYLKIYEAEEEAITTAYTRDGDFILQREFSDGSELINVDERITVDKTTFDTEGKSVAKIALAAAGGRLDWKFGATTSVEGKAAIEALKQGPVAFEISFYRPKLTNASNYGGIDLFGSLFATSGETTLKVAGNTYANEHIPGEWTTMTTVLEYDKEGNFVDIADLMINGKHKTLDKASSIGTVDSLLTNGSAKGLLFYFRLNANEANTTYIDYIRVYPVSKEDSVFEKEEFTTEWSVDKMIYDIDFNSSYNPQSIKKSGGKYPDIVKTAEGESALFVKHYSTGANVIQTFPIDDSDIGKLALKQAMEGVVADEATGTEAVTPKEIAFEVKFKVNETSYSREILAPLINVRSGILDVCGNHFDVVQDQWYKVALILDFNNEGGAKLKNIIINDEYVPFNKTVCATYFQKTTDKLPITPDNILNYVYNGSTSDVLLPVTQSRDKDSLETDIRMYVDYIKVYTVAEAPVAFTKADGTEAEAFADAVNLNLAKKDVAEGSLVVVAYYNSENLMIGTNEITLTETDLANDVITKALDKANGASGLKVFVFRSGSTLQPAVISPLSL